ncbi:MAG: GFA family protein [Phenylobacterium sp.]|uniref:GFA family protein n=1 Tax=Phenylobacterium sp. TaxID=1871053 RepID=UPI001A6225D4|nr:GFA family protein [Phenylobacterium sp.]MBL8554419.1 GFA family protein [Phenylobacterium sp.]
MAFTGGCQCGAVRFEAGRLGRSSICHCRMCQKATGGLFGPYVDVFDFTWTRGPPRYFASSEAVKRGFCGACGTPLSFEMGESVGVSIGALDDPELAPPARQLVWPAKLSYVDRLGGLPHWTNPKTGQGPSETFAAVKSNQDTSS